MYLAARPSTLRTYAGYFLSAQPKLLIDSMLVNKPLCLMNSLKCPMSWRDVNMFDSRWPSSFQGATHLNSPDLTASRKHLRAHSLWLFCSWWSWVWYGSCTLNLAKSSVIASLGVGVARLPPIEALKAGLVLAQVRTRRRRR